MRFASFSAALRRFVLLPLAAALLLLPAALHAQQLQGSIRDYKYYGTQLVYWTTGEPQWTPDGDGKVRVILWTTKELAEQKGSGQQVFRVTRSSLNDGGDGTRFLERIVQEKREREGYPLDITSEASLNTFRSRRKTGLTPLQPRNPNFASDPPPGSDVKVAKTVTYTIVRE